MTTRELILSQLDRLSEEELEVLYKLVKQFLHSRQQKTTEPSFLERLSHIRIDGPEDFAENIDLYLSGEKQVVMQDRGTKEALTFDQHFVQAGFVILMAVEGERGAGHPQNRP